MIEKADALLRQEQQQPGGDMLADATVLLRACPEVAAFTGDRDGIGWSVYCSVVAGIRARRRLRRNRVGGFGTCATPAARRQHGEIAVGSNGVDSRADDLLQRDARFLLVLEGAEEAIEHSQGETERFVGEQTIGRE